MPHVKSAGQRDFAGSVFGANSLTRMSCIPCPKGDRPRRSSNRSAQKGPSENGQRTVCFPIALN